MIIQTFVGREMSLLFNTLSRFVIAFLSRGECLLISWLQSPSAVILGPEKRKSITISTFPPSICHEVMGPDAMITDFFSIFKTFVTFSFKLTFRSVLIGRMISSDVYFSRNWWSMYWRKAKGQGLKKGCQESWRRGWYRLRWGGGDRGTWADPSIY